MKTLMTLGLTALLALTTQFVWADAAKETATVENFRNAGTDNLLNSAYGYAVFPSIGKGGIGIGGAYGKGAVYVKGKRVGLTSMSQLSYGLQLGGQAYSQIIFFKDERAYSDFSSGNFEFGAQASAVALTAGASAQTSTTGSGSASSGTDKRLNTVTEEQYDERSGMAVYTIAKGGLMYEATISGQKFKYEAL
jgi:lipid-binding SYLF domain-containing protein